MGLRGRLGLFLPDRANAPQNRRSSAGDSRAKLFIIVLTCLVTGYLGVGALVGKRGAFAMLRLHRDIDKHRCDLNKAVELRDRLLQKNKLLEEGSLNLDLLDERTRDVLGYAEADELVVILKPQ
ncbi:MAG: FtsB family cell division protein [Anaplasma sp.]